MTTNVSGTLRLIMAAAVVLAVVVPGFLNRSPYIILLATPAYTALYALGKWQQWALAWRIGGAKQILLSLLVALPIQLVLVAVFFMIGVGASMIVGASRGLQPLETSDVVSAAVLFVLAVAISMLIVRIEVPSDETDLEADEAVAEIEADDAAPLDEDVELSIDPRPLTPSTFFVSPGHWKPDVLSAALRGRGEQVVKVPEAATEDAIAATEARLGVRLPDLLRDLYKRMDGGYVGWLYVPLKPDPGPFYDDWRGAFSIDYSSLASLANLRTVKEHYLDFVDDPEDIPPHADRMIILQARYQDMTLLDYSEGPQPQVRLVDFDEYADRSTNVVFADFDSFFQALRRPRPERKVVGKRLMAFRTKPIGEIAEVQQSSTFWGGYPHVFANHAAASKDGSDPKTEADDALIAETERRLGVVLPAALTGLWRVRNGGTLSARYLQTSGPADTYAEAELPEQLMPLEYVATVGQASDRIAYPAGETSLRDRHREADRLVILEARQKAAVLLDYRSAAATPRVLIVEDIEAASLDDAIQVDSVDLLLGRLRAWKSAS